MTVTGGPDPGMGDRYLLVDHLEPCIHPDWSVDDHRYPGSVSSPDSSFVTAGWSF